MIVFSKQTELVRLRIELDTSSISINSRHYFKMKISSHDRFVDHLLPQKEGSALIEMFKAARVPLMCEGNTVLDAASYSLQIENGMNLVDLRWSQFSMNDCAELNEISGVLCGIASKVLEEYV